MQCIYQAAKALETGAFGALRLLWVGGVSFATDHQTKAFYQCSFQRLFWHLYRVSLFSVDTQGPAYPFPIAAEFPLWTSAVHFLSIHLHTMNIETKRKPSKPCHNVDISSFLLWSELVGAQVGMLLELPQTSWLYRRGIRWSAQQVPQGFPNADRN